MGSTGGDAVTDGGGAYDAPLVKHAVRQLLAAIGEDPEREGLVDTPDRVVRSYAEIFGGSHTDPEEHLRTTFQVDTDDLVIVKDIEFHSMCEHHLLPFFGTVSIAYLPRNGVVTGLSKLARCVECYARRAQVQERLTKQISEALSNALDPLGTAVVVQAEHMCMTMRGVRKTGALTVTSRFTGDLQEAANKREVLELF